MSESAAIQLPCVVCGVVPEPAMAGLTRNQPYAATAFTSEGHYGSTFFDANDRSWIEINICDDHLRANAERVKRFRNKAVQSDIEEVEEVS